MAGLDFTSALDFKNSVLLEVINSLKLNTFTDNYDKETFDTIEGKDNSLVFNTSERLYYFDWFYKNYEVLFEVYGFLTNASSRLIFFRLVCFRLAGHHSFRIGASYTTLSSELEEFKLAERKTKSELAIDGMFGKLLHYDFDFLGKHYVVDCFGLEYYLQRKQYFYNEGDLKIMPEEGDFVIDGGACLGDTAAVFSNAVGPKGKVYSFDPVADHLEILQYNINQFPIKNVELIPSGLSNINTEFAPLRLNTYNPGFQTNWKELPLVTIDTLVEKSIVSRIDFIKLDVEGSEIAALQGAQRSISIFQPKLAISLYHKPNDFFEIINFVKTFFPFYKNLVIEHYSIQMGESVLYASK